MKNLYIFLFVLIFVCFGRLIPHPPNFTPILAIAVFLPALSKDKLIGISSLLLPMIITDYIIGFHQSMIWVYLSVVISTLIGYFFYKTNNNLIYYGSMCIISSLTFFLITNFTVWLFTTMYPKNLEGIITCYYMAIPFFHNTLLSTIIYTVIITNLFVVFTTIYARSKIIKSNL